jgi:hypothetical protein
MHIPLLNSNAPGCRLQMMDNVSDVDPSQDMSLLGSVQVSTSLVPAVVLRALVLGVTAVTSKASAALRQLLALRGS